MLIESTRDNLIAQELRELEGRIDNLAGEVGHLSKTSERLEHSQSKVESRIEMLVLQLDHKDMADKRRDDEIKEVRSIATRANEAIIKLQSNIEGFRKGIDRSKEMTKWVLFLTGVGASAAILPIVLRIIK